MLIKQDNFNNYIYVINKVIPLEKYISLVIHGLYLEKY